MNPETQPAVSRLPVARTRARIVPYQLASGTTPDEARRFVAVVSGERTIMGALKCERSGFASSDFVAKVVNYSDEALSCTLTGWTERGLTSVAPGHFWINPQTVAQIPIRAPLRLPYPLRTISLHIQNSSMRASAEADVPTPPALRSATALALAGALVLAGVTAWQSLCPKIAAYAMPGQVVAGDRATASYAISGMGTAQYDVIADGVRIASGKLAGATGSFSFVTLKHAAVYHVALSVFGPLGAAHRELIASGVPLSRSDSVAIQALQPDPSVVRSGEPIDVRYVADAQSGSVTLFDATGIPLQRAPYSAAGSSTLTAPTVETPTQYRVELVVTRGSKTSQASAGLLVLPKPNANPGEPAAIPGLLTARQVFRIEPSYLTSQTAFAVRLLVHPLNLRLSFEDDLGQRIASESVAATTSLVRFSAPWVVRDRSYLIVASFSNGRADQVLLQPVIVHVRPGETGP
ncbi:MAG TPA: hypothetical protein VIN40_10065 [Candidatus Tyrphobacter sp.]